MELQETIEPGFSWCLRRQKLAALILSFLTVSDLRVIRCVDTQICRLVTERLDTQVQAAYRGWKDKLLGSKKKPKLQNFKIVEDLNGQTLIKLLAFDCPYLTNSLWKQVTAPDAVLRQRINQEKFISGQNFFIFKNAAEDLLIMNRSLLDSGLNLEDQQQLLLEQ